MSRIKKPSRSDDEYDQFEALAKALVSVPKSEIQAEADRDAQAKKRSA